MTGEKDDAEHADGESHHEPCLHAAGQHAAGYRAAIDDRRGAGSLYLVGHGYRSRASKGSLTLPIARYPRSRTLGTT